MPLTPKIRQPPGVRSDAGGPATWRRRRRLAGVAVLLLAVAGGCNRAHPEHTYLVAVEPPFWHAVTAAYPTLESELQRTVVADGRRLQLLLVATEEPLAELAEHLAGARYAGVVLPPLLSFEAEALAAAHPAVRFVLLTWTGSGSASRPEPPANVTEVSIERAAAHERAGRLVAAYLADRPEARVAVVAAAGSGEAAGVAAFRAGMAAGGAPDRVSEHSFDAGGGSAALRDSLEAAAGAEVVHLQVGELTGEALRSLADSGRLAVVSNWGNRPGFEATVLVSVDDPGLPAIVAGIEAPAGVRTVVPARVVWGLAAPLPNAAAGLYDGVRAAPMDAGSVERTERTGERSPTGGDS